MTPAGGRCPNPLCDGTVTVREGEFGEFLGCSNFDRRKRVGCKECQTMDERTLGHDKSGLRWIGPGISMPAAPYSTPTPPRVQGSPPSYTSSSYPPPTRPSPGAYISQSSPEPKEPSRPDGPGATWMWVLGGIAAVLFIYFVFVRH